MDKPTLITRSEDASKGSWQSIIKIEGELKGIDIIERPANEDYNIKEGWSAQVTLMNPTVVQMLPGEEPPEFKESKYTFTMSYCAKGKSKPSANNFYSKFFLTSAEALAKARGVTNGGLTNLFGSKVVLEFVEKILWEETDKKTNEKVKHTAKGFVFVADGAGAEPIESYVKKLISGQVTSQALRLLGMDSRTKAEPKWRTILDKPEELAKLGLKIDEEADKIVEAK